MFILDLQGEPRGLSIGGLAVITKSLSLSVSCADVVHLLKTFHKARNTAILYCKAVTCGQGGCPTVGILEIHKTENTVTVEFK